MSVSKTMPSESPGKSPERRATTGTVLTFYSYKGGVGRSMAVANVAALLAKWGRRVLVVDWDLEAPGIENYFERPPSRLDGYRSEKPGILDLLLALQQRERLDWRTCLLKAKPYPDAPAVSILSAGRDNQEYVGRLGKLNWEQLFDEHDLGGYLHELREEWADEFDFVLVDSRTGINDIGGICSIILPDILVFLFTTNDQSFEGARKIAARAREAQAELPVDRGRLLAVPVPARDESRSEYDDAKAWRKRFAEDLEPFFSDWLPRGTTPYSALSKLYVPYWPKWSFGERLPVVEAPEEMGDPAKISSAYARLAALIDSGLDWAAVEGGAHKEREEARAEAAATKASAKRKVRRILWTSLIAVLVLGIAAVLIGRQIVRSSTNAPDPLIAASEETRLLIERGLQYLTQEDETRRSIEDAIQMFHRATEEEPSLGLGWALLGEANWRRYDRWGREPSSREEAVRAVNKAFRLDPALPEAFNARGYGHLLTGNITAAKVDFLPAVRGRPDFDRAWANLGRAHEKLYEYGPGITALNTAIRLRPDEYRHRVRLGIFYYHFTEFDAAADAYQQALRINPQASEALDNLGGTYIQMSRPADAEKVLLRSLALRETPEARDLLGTAYYYLGQFQKATNNYMLAIDQNPENAFHWANLGNALQMLGRAEESLETYHAAIRLARKQVQTTPDDPHARLNLALYCARGGDSECAIQEGKWVAEMELEGAELLFRLSIIYSLVDQEEEALDWLEEAVRQGLSRNQIENDPDLPALSGHPRYQHILELAG